VLLMPSPMLTPLVGVRVVEVDAMVSGVTAPTTPLTCVPVMMPVAKLKR
jgi:hypothetical protein